MQRSGRWILCSFRENDTRKIEKEAVWCVHLPSVWPYRRLDSDEKVDIFYGDVAKLSSNANRMVTKSPSLLSIHFNWIILIKLRAFSFLSLWMDHINKLFIFSLQILYSLFRLTSLLTTCSKLSDAAKHQWQEKQLNQNFLHVQHIRFHIMRFHVIYWYLAMNLISKANKQTKTKFSCTKSKCIKIFTHIWEIFTRKRTTLYHSSWTSPKHCFHLLLNCCFSGMTLQAWTLYIVPWSLINMCCEFLPITFPTTSHCFQLFLLK